MEKVSINWFSDMVQRNFESFKTSFKESLDGTLGTIYFWLNRWIGPVEVPECVNYVANILLLVQPSLSI